MEALRGCCRALGSEKLKERRDGAVLLRDLLSNMSLCKRLGTAEEDEDDVDAGDGGVGWLRVLESAVTYFQKEMTKLESDARAGKNLSTGPGLSREAVSLVRLVAELASRGGAAQTVASLTPDVLLKALRHPYRREAVGPELCAAVQATLLRPAAVWRELTLSAWRQLVSTCRTLLQETPTRMERSTPLTLLATAARLGCRQTALLPRVLAQLPLLPEHGVPAPEAGLRQLASASAAAAFDLVNTTLRLAAPEARLAVCQIGQQLFPRLVQLTDSRHHHQQLLLFLQLQLVVRTPGCDRTAYAAGPTEWQAQLRQMYQLIVDEATCRSRNARLIGGAASQNQYLLSAGWLRLFSWVGYLLFEADEQLVDVTQLPSCTAAEQRPAKRRRLAAGIQPLCEQCHELRGSLECVPWLQLLTELLRDHQDLLSAQQLATARQQLVSWSSADSRRPEVVQHQLLLAAALLRSSAAGSGAEDWQRLWQLAVKASSMVQCRTAAHMVLQALLRRGAARPDSGLLHLYRQPAAAAGPLLRTLLLLLRLRPLPPPADPAVDVLQTRRRLLDWLLAATDVPATDVAEALTRLVLRDSTATLQLPAASRRSETDDVSSDLEELYRRTDLQTPFLEREGGEDEADTAVSGLACVPELRSHLLDAVNKQLTEGMADDSEDCRRRAAATAARAVALLRFWCSCGLVSDTELDTLATVQHLSSMMDRLLGAVSRHISVNSNIPVASLSSLLADLGALFSLVAASYTEEGREDFGRRKLARLLVSSVPAAFIDACLGLVMSSAPHGGIDSQSMDVLDNFEAAELHEGLQDEETPVLAQVLSEKDELRLRACCLLTSIAASDLGAGWRSEVGVSATRLLTELSQGPQEVRLAGDLRIAVHLLKTVPHSPALVASHLPELSSLLLCVCRQWPRDAAVNEVVLDTMHSGYLQRVASLGSSKDRADAVKFATVMQKKFQLARFGEPCVLSHLRVLALLARMDPAGHWAVVDGRWAGEPLLCHLSAPPQLEETSGAVGDGWSSHRSRMLSADLLQEVFAAREREPAADGAAPPLLEMFAEVNTAAIRGLATPEMSESDGDAAQDDVCNRAAALCTALARVAIGSATCRPQALLALCQAVRARGVQMPLVLRTLRQLATALGMAGPRPLLVTHLDYVMSQWLEQLSVVDFPYQLLEYGSAEEFMSGQLAPVVPHLLAGSDGALTGVSELLRRPPAALVLACLPQVVVHVLPALAGKAAGPRRAAAAQRLYTAARQHVGSAEAFDRALAAQTPAVVSALFRAYGAEPARLQACLEYAADSIYGCGLVSSLLRAAEDGVQSVLLQLATDAATAAGDARPAAVRRYCALVTLLARQFDQLNRRHAAFVIYDVTACVAHRAASLRLPADAPQATLYVSAVTELCRACAETAPDLVAARLQLVCATLVRLHQTGQCGADLRAAAKAALTLLLRDRAHLYPDAAAAVTCVPPHGELAALVASAPRTGLQCLAAAGRQPSVQALQAALSAVEADAAAPPPCQPSILSKLLRTATEAGDETRHVAARVLGALGVQPLTTTTVRAPPDIWSDCGAEGSDQTRDVHLLWQLTELVTDCDPAVVACAGRALRAFLAGSGGPPAQDLLAAQVPHLVDRLHPFFATRQQLARERVLSRAEALLRLDVPALWTPDDGDYEAWLLKLTTAVLEVAVQVSPELAAFGPLCQVKGASFCRLLLPYATRAALLSDPQLRVVLGGRMSRLLEDYVRAEQESGTHSPADARCAGTLLDVLLYLRQQPLPEDAGRPDSAWQRHFWVDVNLAAAAGAALRCGHLCEAVLLAEVCCYAQQREPAAPLLPPSAEGEELRSLLREAHARLGDADGVAALRGLGDDDATLMEQEGDWAGALACHDWQSGAQSAVAAQAGLLRCLAQLQLFSCSATQLRGLTSRLAVGEPVPPHLAEAACEAVWRLADWTLPVPTTDPASPPGLQRSLYACVSAVRDGDGAAATLAVRQGRAAALAAVSGAAAPSAHAASLCLSRLRLLRRTELLLAAADDGDSSQLSALCARWREEACSAGRDGGQFELREPELSFRAALLEVLRDRRPDQLEGVRETRRVLLLQLSELARASGRLPAAERAARLLNASGVAGDAPAGALAVARCAAENSWARGDAARALGQCRALLRTAEEGDGSVLERAQLRVLYARWLSEQHAETARHILEEQLRPAIQQLETIGQDAGAPAALVEAHHLAAQYADAQFQRLDQLLNSPACADKRAEAARMREEAAQFRKRAATAREQMEAKDLRRQEVHLSRSAELDESELSQHEEERAAFLRQAVDSYLRCLQLADSRDLLVYRLVALWLADESGQVCAQLAPAAPSLPSHKLVSPLQQLAARLGRPGWDAASAALLERLLLRCAAEHPHHALPVLLALQHARADGGGTAAAPDAAAEQRTATATKLLQKLRHPPPLAEHVTQLEAVSLALIQLAYQPHSSGAQGQMRSASALWRDGAAPAVAVQTVPLRVRPDADYSSAVTVVRWDRTFTMVGGVNAPKKLRCLGSDGRWWPQLLKGHDDLRQDAVMQQVFAVVNQLLGQDTAPGQLSLAVRCYKVVPLSQRSGLIEWCADTQPLAEYLTGSTGAHARYRPEDMSVREARRAMTEVAKKSTEQRRRAFANVCARLQPVLRHFFWERFPGPSEWFERRVAYTNSLAAASIAGYVLGLGDRHVSNILIDLTTAEVVHIDLGVAFETGRLLPTPETVPFRLTRDLVDGMGVCGVAGRFERSCQRTLSVLRDSSQVVLTIVRVLLEDPLYAWTLTADKVSRLQQRRVAQHSDNRQAERVLSRLGEKLRGQELGQVMGCAAQVSHLIQQARDPDNLSLLFHGWQAYL